MTEFAEVTFTVKVDFESDWAFGVGHGRHGGVDNLVERDSDGLPFVRGKTMAALLREEAEIVAIGMDGPTGDDWQRWVEYVFGTHPQQRLRSENRVPRPAALSPRRLTLVGRDAILGHDMKSTGLSRAELIESLFVIRPGVARDPLTGVARDDFLRFEEFATAGLAVTSQWAISLPKTDDAWPAVFLLKAAARLLTHVGRKRRRGAGRARLQLQSDQLPPLTELTNRIDALAGRVPPAPVLWDELVNREGTGLLNSSERERRDLAHALNLELTVMSPVIVDSGLRGNVVLTEDFIPGTLLLPLVASALGSAATDLIARDELVVTDATLAVDEGRALPWPANLQRSKDESGDGNYLVTTRRQTVDPRRKPRAQGYVSQHATGVAVAEVPTVRITHNQVEAEKGRPSEASGGPFVYTAIAAGTVLRAEVWLPRELDADEFARGLAGRHRVGVSKKDDYGDVQIVSTLAGAATARAEGIPEGAEFAIWLTADAILVDDFGVFDPTPTGLERALRKAGLAVELVAHATAGGEAVRAVALTAVRRRESWQRRWGLPRPSLVGLRAGSVVMLRAEAELDPETLRIVESSGIGQRRVEGFGRLIIDAPYSRQDSVAVHTVIAGGRPDAVSSGDPVDANLVARAWSRKLPALATAVALDESERANIIPAGAHGAQLGNLRSLIEGLTLMNGQIDSAAFRSWAASVRRIEGRQKTWGRHIDRLDSFVTAVPNHKHPVWGALGLAPEVSEGLPAGNVGASLVLEAVQRLLLEIIRVQGPSKKKGAAR